MSTGRVRFGFAGMLAVIAAVLVPAVAGGAGKSVVSKNFLFEQHDTSPHSVSCPKHKVPTGGGFTFQQTTSSVELQESHPTRKGWTVEGRNTESEGRTGTVIAKCSTAGGISVKSKTHKFDQADTDVQLTAHCPDGSKAVGGGGELVGGGSAVQIGSFPAGAGKTWGTRWKMTPDRALKLKAYAICSRRIRGYEVTSGSAEVEGRQRGNSGFATALATCPDGKKLVSGGYFRTSPGTFYSKVGPTGPSWEVTAFGFEGDGSLISFGICGK